MLVARVALVVTRGGWALLWPLAATAQPAEPKRGGFGGGVGPLGPKNRHLGVLVG
jgi:hypothetical protein